jgi:hypothetical protein
MRWRRATSREPLAFESFGVRCQIVLGDPELEPRVREILPPGYQSRRPSRTDAVFGLRRTDEDSYEVTIDGRQWIDHGTLEIAMNLLDAQLRVHIAVNTPDLIFVHAGVVAHGRQALLIPGGSFSGKTTLVGALVQAGATYYSDEYAVLDAAGRVHPYPRRLSFRGIGERHVSELGGVAGEESADVAIIVLTHYRAGADWQPEHRSHGRGLVALLANTVPAVTRPRESLSALHNAVAGVTVLESDRGEAGPVAEVLLEELAAIAR